MKIRRSAVAALLPVGLLLFAACGGDDGEEMAWTADITSVDQALFTVNEEDETVYGWNRLAGEAEIDGETVEVDMLGTVDYVNGSGPFGGFVTLTFPDGTLLSLRQDGEAQAATDTSDAELGADLTVIGGTGRFLDASGDGEWTGYRDETLGGAVRMEVELDIVLADD